MDLDSIKLQIQNFFQENTLTIVGSGLSCAEGMPGMSHLARVLQAEIPSKLLTCEDKQLWEKIDKDLKKGIGLEQALHNTKPSPKIEDSIRTTTAHLMGKNENIILQDVILNGRTLRFEKYLKRFNIRNNGLVVVTTNYDRLIEYACESQNIRIDNLFVGQYLAHFDPEHSRYSFCERIERRSRGQHTVVFAPKVTILKPHGCLSWHMINGVPYSIPNYPVDDSLIITPGINKYKEGYSDPFDTHRTRANQEINQAQRYIIIGYGFADSHLETHLIQQLNTGKQALILTYALSPKAYRLIKTCQNVIGICSDGKSGSVIITQAEETVFPALNLWDLEYMIEEVF